MSEMVERVARALADLDADYEPDEILEGDDFPFWQYFKHDARVVIAAMREPTEAMLHAAWAVYDDDWCGETNALNMWQAQIDEALK